MGTIYAGSMDVLVWLGDEEAVVGAILAMQETMRGIAPRKGSLAYSDLCKRLNFLTVHEYWTRAWIVQEVIQARAATLLAGDEAFKLDEARHLMQTIEWCYGPHPSKISCVT